MRELVFYPDLHYLNLMKFNTILLVLILMTASSASAVSWSSTVSTNTSSWSIYRQSESLTFDYSQLVQGTISPVDYHGRTLSPFYSGYQEINVNDVRQRERTSAFEGSYSSEEQTSLRSDAYNPVYINISKPSGSPIFTILYFEQWPVILRSSKALRYSGKEINDREFEGNNLDFVGSDFLYNKELSKDTSVGLLLKRMNATVQATNDSILSAQFLPIKEMDYRVAAQTTGIADLKYRQTGPDYDIKHQTYFVTNEGEERYIGPYNISRHIHMNFDFQNNSRDYDWMSCNFCGWDSMNYYDKKSFGASTKGVFDCTCYKVPSIAQFPQ